MTPEYKLENDNTEVLRCAFKGIFQKEVRFHRAASKYSEVLKIISGFKVSERV